MYVMMKRCEDCADKKFIDLMALIGQVYERKQMTQASIESRKLKASHGHWWLAVYYTLTPLTHIDASPCKLL